MNELIKAIEEYLSEVESFYGPCDCMDAEGMGQCDLCYAREKVQDIIARLKKIAEVEP